MDNDVFAHGYTSYIPAAPSGPASGEVNAEYGYTIYSLATGSSWKFDWGDGTFSDWVTLGESDTSITQTHSWDEPGTYQIQVKYRSKTMDESEWSNPTSVSIDFDSDIDNDGWSNDLESLYGTNPEDPDDFPLDVDNDGSPNSADADDDNDGLSDEIENTLGSNPLSDSDVTILFIENTLFYYVDTDDDGLGNYLYNSNTEKSNEISNIDGVSYLDINNDNNWDYTYDGYVQKYQAPFEIPWLYVILGVIIGVLITIFLLFKTGVFYLYEEEYIVEE